MGLLVPWPLTIARGLRPTHSRLHLKTAWLVLGVVQDTGRGLGVKEYRAGHEQLADLQARPVKILLVQTLGAEHVPKNSRLPLGVEN